MKLRIPQEVVDILRVFEENGYEIYIVGGAVRDLLMGRPRDDWDFTTNATPEQMLEIFKDDAFYNNRFGTVGVHSKSSEYKPHQITTFRSDHGYSDGRRPDKVVWGESIEDDLARRDFTINSIALKKTSKDEYEFIDPYSGKEDISDKKIKAVGIAKDRFEEDALRMMRAVRFAAQLGFRIESETQDAIKDSSPRLIKVSMERIHDELMKILSSPDPSYGFKLLREVGLLEFILPELVESFSVSQKSPQRHHIYDVGTHCLMALQYCKSQDPIVRFATLLHDVGKPKTHRKLETGVVTFYNHEVVGARMTYEIARRLRFSKEDTKRLVKFVRWHQFSVDEKQTDSALRRLIRNVGVEDMDEMLSLRVADRLGGGAAETSWRLEEFKKRLREVQSEPFSIKDLEIDGSDVMKVLGIGPGPEIGKVLNLLFKKVEEKEIENKRDILLEKIKEVSSS